MWRAHLRMHDCICNQLIRNTLTFDAIKNRMHLLSRAHTFHWWHRPEKAHNNTDLIRYNHSGLHTSQRFKWCLMHDASLDIHKPDHLSLHSEKLLFLKSFPLKHSKVVLFSQQIVLYNKVACCCFYSAWTQKHFFSFVTYSLLACHFYF